MPDVQSRRMSPFGSGNKPQKKFLIRPLYNLLRPSSTASSSASSGPVSTLTVTSYNTISSTATVAVIQSCISSGQFAASGTGLSTAPCSRRKRSSPDDLLVEVDPSQIQP